MTVKWLLALIFLVLTPVTWATNAPSCLQSAAEFHGVNPHLLLAVLQVESGLNPRAVGKNTNGTVDLGIGQINSMHLPELQRYGVTEKHLLDACKGAYVSAWFLKRGLERHGYTWFGAAAYHSVTPVHNTRYQGLLKNQLARQGISLNPALTVSTMTLASMN
ncbi:invasion protein IagB [Burkholderiaceae bacterium]